MAAAARCAAWRRERKKAGGEEARAERSGAAGRRDGTTEWRATAGTAAVESAAAAFVRAAGRSFWPQPLLARASDDGGHGPDVRGARGRARRLRAGLVAAHR